MDALTRAKTDLDKARLALQAARADEAKKLAALKATEKNAKELVERAQRANAELEALQTQLAECAELTHPAEALVRAREAIVRALEREALRPNEAEQLSQERKNAEGIAAAAEKRLADVRAREQRNKKKKELQTKLDQLQRTLDAHLESESNAHQRAEDLRQQLSEAQSELRTFDAARGAKS